MKRESLSLPLAALTPNPDNPRTIKRTALAKLRQSIADFPEMLGLRPIVVDEDNVILGGNMRYTALVAMQQAGETHRGVDFGAVSVVRVSGLTPAQKREFVIKDNTPYGDWDWDKLANEFDKETLENWGLDTKLGKWEPEPLKEPPMPEGGGGQTDSVIGGVYALGEHRLLCGSATDARALQTLLGGGGGKNDPRYGVQLMITDPPYNVNYVGKTADALKIQNDNMEDTQFVAFIADFMRAAMSVMTPGGVFYVFSPSGDKGTLVSRGVSASAHIRQQLVWDKGAMVLGHSDYQYRHECIWYGWDERARHYFCNNRTLKSLIDGRPDFQKMSKAELVKFCQGAFENDSIPSDVVHAKRPNHNALHPTMKPVELIAKLIRNSYDPRGVGVIFDPFGGSGSTLLASEQLGHICYTVELDPHYCDVIRRRYQMLLTDDGSDDGWQDATPRVGTIAPSE